MTNKYMQIIQSSTNWAACLARLVTLYKMLIDRGHFNLSENILFPSFLAFL